MNKKSIPTDFLLLQEKKKELKILAQEIKEKKTEFNKLQRELGKIPKKNLEERHEIRRRIYSCVDQRKELTRIYRHLNVAYGELRGINRSEIEKILVKAKKLSEELIDELKS